MPASGDQRVRRESARLNRGPYALAAFGVCQSRGVTREQYSVADQRTWSRARRMICMTSPHESGGVGHPAALGEKGHEIPNVSLEARAFTTSDPDVEEIVFPNAPAITLEVAAEKQFGRI